MPVCAVKGKRLQEDKCCVLGVNAASPSPALSFNVALLKQV